MSSNGTSSQSQYSTAVAHTSEASVNTLTTTTMEDNFVISSAEIRGIIIDTCRRVVGNGRYEHREAGNWNSEIITTILNRLMSELDRQSEKRFKLIVNSSIAQAIAPIGEATGPSGTRGLHVANAAFWDPPFDGMFSHKYAADGQRDFDVIVSIVWLSHDGYMRHEPAPAEHKPPQIVA